ncbi:MAG TPA: thioredoxin family protein [Candidatus Solibacter sp.]|nr:thioredoxin family protein [Candidatus Solibacter sp.]
MTKRIRQVLLVMTLLPIAAWSQTSEANFPPFEQWKGAVLAGDASGLRALYSSDPAAQIEVNRVHRDADADINFWLGLKARSMNVGVVRNEARHGHISFIVRAEVVSGQPGNPTVTVTEDQSWKQQGDQWRLIYVERTDAPQLKQPADMKKNLYPADADAHAEIKEAEERASSSAIHKRLLLVFGANWCFDCHVLDLAFQRPEIAPVLAENYEVVHIDLGPEEEKNADLVKQYDIPLNKGVPALAVAESDGKLVVSQNNGEFEDARALTPDVLLEFLNKWKPQAR